MSRFTRAPRSLPAPRRLSGESLESRQLMAGNVDLLLTGGNLFITGDNEANGLLVRQLSANQFAIIGIKQGAGNTTVQGENFKVVSGVTGNVFMNMLGGNDAVQIDDGAGFIAARPGLPSLGQFPVFHKNMQINLGAGADTLTTDGMEVEGRMIVDTGFGSEADVVQLTNLETEAQNTGGLGLEIDTFGGADRVELIDNLHGGLVDIDTGTEDDIVSIVDSFIVAADLVIRTQAGDDNVTLDNVLAHLDVTIDTGNDLDFVDIKDSDILATLDVKLGNGNDLLRLDDVTAHRAELDGDGGTDALIDNDNNTFKTLVVEEIELVF